ncbi:type II secretion system protein GspL [Candidatus Fukatsuia symbiotica]|nr:type II secretion system protein GspL [Candidatus Fukatsuia symbiotica]MEA9443989.1 type II secretion system protein GspL [Candidatus Fukatsuia symbiotica]
MEKTKSIITGKLVIRLGKSEDKPIYWSIIIPEKKGNDKHGCFKNIHELIQLSKYAHYRTMILAPADCIIFRRISFVRKVNIKSIPYLLEEFIATDAEQLHIIKLQQQGKDFFIAAIEKSLIHQWLQWLKSAKLSADSLIPDILALPSFDDAWTAIKLDQQWLIRKDQVSGFLINSSDFNQLIPHVIHPKTIHTFSTQEKSDIHWISHPSIEPILLLAENVDSVKINFLQGEFIAHSKKKKYIDEFCRLSLIIFIFFVIFFSRLIFDGYKNNQHAEYINNKSLDYYNMINPVANNITNINLADKKYLSVLKERYPCSIFMQLMAKINLPLLAEPLVNITEIEFNQDEKKLGVRFNLIDKDIISQLASHFGKNFSIEVDNRKGNNFNLSLFKEQYEENKKFD